MDPLLLIVVLGAALAAAYAWSSRPRRDARLEADVQAAAESGDVAGTRRALGALKWGPGSFRWNLWLGRAILVHAESTQDNTRLQEGGNLLLRAYGQSPDSPDGQRARGLIDGWLAPYGVRPQTAVVRPSRAGPATLGLLALLAAAFLVELAASGDWGNALSISGIDVNTLAALGGNGYMLTVQQGEWWRIFSSLLLHGGLLHIGFNGYALLVFGREVEARAGAGLLLLVFVLGGAIGSLLSAYLGQPNAVSVGASGAIFALLGFVSVFGAHTLQARLAQLRRALPNLLLVFVVNGVIIRNVDNWAHGGGLVAGVLLGLLLARPRGAREAALGAASLAALAWGALSGLRMAGLL